MTTMNDSAPVPAGTDPTGAATSADPAVSLKDTPAESPEPDPSRRVAESRAPEQGEGEGGGNREAARYRTRLREVEAERDGLRERLAAVQRAEVERLAGDRLAVPGDLFDIGGHDLAGLLDDAGDVDRVRVEQAVGGLLDTRPGLARQTRQKWPDMGQGQRGSTRASGWESSFKAR